jgi:hypothetical protein
MLSYHKRDKLSLLDYLSEYSQIMVYTKNQNKKEPSILGILLESQKIVIYSQFIYQPN